MHTVTVFAYGTLITEARSKAVRDLLERCLVTAREGFIRGRLYDLGPYPGLVPAPTRNEHVRGRLLTLKAPHRSLALLDDYEDYDPRCPNTSPYVRTRSRVALAAGGRTLAWVYWYQERLKGASRIADGDWRAWLARGAGR